MPRGAHLLGGENKGGAQLLLVDLLTHCWRTWDHVQKWAADLPAVQTIVNAANAKTYLALKKWGDVDPVYRAMVERYPNPDAKA